MSESTPGSADEGDDYIERNGIDGLFGSLATMLAQDQPPDYLVYLIGVLKGMRAVSTGTVRSPEKIAPSLQQPAMATHHIHTVSIDQLRPAVADTTAPARDIDGLPREEKEAEEDEAPAGMAQTQQLILNSDSDSDSDDDDVRDGNADAAGVEEEMDPAREPVALVAESGAGDGDPTGCDVPEYVTDTAANAPSPAASTPGTPATPPKATRRDARNTVGSSAAPSEKEEGGDVTDSSDDDDGVLVRAQLASPENKHTGFFKVAAANA